MAATPVVTLDPTWVQPSSRPYKLSILAAGAFLIVCYAYIAYPRNSVWPIGDHSYNIEHDSIVFSDRLFQALERHGPSIPPLSNSGPNASSLVFWKATADTPRPDLLVMSESNVASMRAAHDAFYNATKSLVLPFSAETLGVVTTAGKGLIPVMIVSLRMLRRTGCKLPVEVMLENPDEEPYLCDVLLPALNARCIFLSDYLGPRTVQTFAFKIFSVLFSSFENILYLDADNFPVVDPSPLFENELFLANGLVTWPDFWASSASRHLYEVQSLATPAMNLRPSSESGQFLVSKQSHGHALLMAAYYNFYGPTHYFRLMSQGASGQGDKETYVAGAEVTNSSFYQTRAVVDTMGYYEGPGDKGYHGVAMVQYDPMHDADDVKHPMFIHHNYPKLDPLILFSQKSGSRGEGAAVVDVDKGLYRRLWGPKPTTVERFGKDVEAEVWQELEYIACEVGNMLKGWKASPGDARTRETKVVRNTCELVREYRRAIFDV